MLLCPSGAQKPDEPFSQSHSSTRDSKSIKKIPELFGQYIYCCCRFIEKRNLEFVFKGYAQYKMTA